MRLHPYNIAQKVQIVVEHFRENVAPLLEGGQGDGGASAAARRRCAGSSRSTNTSRIAATALGTLVAFSGEVKDQRVRSRCRSPRPATRSIPTCSGRDIREAFNSDEFQILLRGQQVPDRVRPAAAVRDVRGPSGLRASRRVQTLSRLNRPYPGKDTTYVLDFANGSEDVLRAFRTYYSTGGVGERHAT